MKKKNAFTLAEVLITLGVIGIVAAMTLPTVINKYRIKQLKTAFLRSSSQIQNALNETAYEYGLNNFSDFNSICGNVSKEENGACRSANQNMFEDISSYFISRFKNIKIYKSSQLGKLKIGAIDYSGNYNFNYSSLYGIGTYATPHASAYVLVDGTMISAIAFFYHEPSDGISLTFDTNGPHKGPNRYGYDIFLYNTGRWSQFCSKNIANLYNGRACYKYALKDVNPDDDIKGYWESLKF